MRVLLCTIGSAGDVHPLIGVGQVLLARGHRATVVANQTFEGLVLRHGLDFAPLGTREEYTATMGDPDLWHATRGFGVIANRMLLPNVERLYNLIARHDPADTVLFAAGTCFGARIAQEHLGFRLVTHHLSPSLLWSRHSPPALGYLSPDAMPRSLRIALHRLTVGIADGALTPAINGFRRHLGLAPARDVMFGWNNSPARVLGLFPEWFASIQPDWPAQLRLIGFPLCAPADAPLAAGEIDALVSGARPPLVFTPGSANIHARQFFAAAIGASQQLGYPAILLTRHREQLPETLPPGIVHRDYIPLDAILPRAAALIHHGGIGTTAQGLAAGVPQVVMPMSHDQPDNALRLRRLGVGDAISPGQFTAPRVATALAKLLGSAEVQACCQTLAARCDRHTSETIVHEIEVVSA